jgi:uncharacterized DUF497 family protein
VFRFEWDEDKAEENLRKHGVSFLDATTAFLDEFVAVLPDEEHSTGEERFILMGETPNGRLIVVVYTEREDSIRIISAREAEPQEARDYRNQKDKA